MVGLVPFKPRALVETGEKKNKKTLGLSLGEQRPSKTYHLASSQYESWRELIHMVDFPTIFKWRQLLSLAVSFTTNQITVSTREENIFSSGVIRPFLLRLVPLSQGKRNHIDKVVFLANVSVPLKIPVSTGRRNKSYQRQCDGRTMRRRLYNVVVVPAGWDASKLFDTANELILYAHRCLKFQTSDFKIYQ